MGERCGPKFIHATTPRAVLDGGSGGRQTRVDPAEVLTHPRTHPHMRVAELALRLRCRDCRHRTARIDPVARLPTQPFVAGMI